MKKIFYLALCTIFLFLAPQTYAASQQAISEKVATLNSDDIVDGNYYTAAEIVEILGTVNGDVYAAGGQVLVNGTINGDLIVAGGTVNISGKITDDVRAAGGQITINAAIGKNLSVAGGNIELTDTTKVGGALQIAGGNLTINSSVAQEILAAGGNLTFRGSANSLEAKVGNLRLAPGAVIVGNLDYWSTEEASISTEASVSGKVTKHELPAQLKGPSSKKNLNKIFGGFNLFSKLTSITTTLILGLLLLKFFPHCTEKSIAILQKRPWASLGLGLAAAVIIPICSILIFITILALPLGVITLTLFIIYLYLSRIYVIIALGQILTKRVSQSTSSFLYLFLGIVIYYVLTSLPIIGSLLKLLIIFFGFGAGLLAAKSTYSEARTKKVF